jgi:hypothetical protein
MSDCPFNVPCRARNRSSPVCQGETPRRFDEGSPASPGALRLRASCSPGDTPIPQACETASQANPWGMLVPRPGMDSPPWWRAVHPDAVMRRDGALWLCSARPPTTMRRRETRCPGHSTGEGERIPAPATGTVRHRLTGARSRGYRRLESAPGPAIPASGPTSRRTGGRASRSVTWPAAARPRTPRSVASPPRSCAPTWAGERPQTIPSGSSGTGRALASNVYLMPDPRGPLQAAPARTPAPSAVVRAFSRGSMPIV